MHEADRSSGDLIADTIIQNISTISHKRDFMYKKSIDGNVIAVWYKTNKTVTLYDKTIEKELYRFFMPISYFEFLSSNCKHYFLVKFIGATNSFCFIDVSNPKILYHEVKISTCNRFIVLHDNTHTSAFDLFERKQIPLPTVPTLSKIHTKFFMDNKQSYLLLNGSNNEKSDCFLIDLCHNRTYKADRLQLTKKYLLLEVEHGRRLFILDRISMRNISPISSYIRDIGKKIIKKGLLYEDYLAIQWEDNSIGFFYLLTGEMLSNDSFKLSPDLNIFAFKSVLSGQLRVYDFNNFTPIITYNYVPQMFDFFKREDGSYGLFLQNNDRSLRFVTDLNKGTRWKATSYTCSPNRRYVAFAVENKGLALFDLNKKTNLLFDQVQTCDFFMDQLGNMFIALHKDDYLKMITFDTKGNVRTLSLDKVWTDHRFLVFHFDDNRVMIFDKRLEQKVVDYQDIDSFEIVGEDEKILVCYSKKNGKVTIFNIITQEIISQFNANNQPKTVCRGTYLLLGPFLKESGTYLIKLFDLEEKKQIIAINTVSEPYFGLTDIKNVAEMDDGQYLQFSLKDQPIDRMSDYSCAQTGFYPIDTLEISDKNQKSVISVKLRDEVLHCIKIYNRAFSIKLKEIGDQLDIQNSKKRKRNFNECEYPPKKKHKENNTKENWQILEKSVKCRKNNLQKKV